ncbi:hypothetical protein PVAP13_4KG379203 [Panicum virgatum]|uniref:Uncharacterized protein n=1 Tax=Panicum virgatum TaxID=38727 RepID=A0A8T0TYB2_PANVG|nr:hypothetical protein PVAP13_4KG379203 [Panicum virgatum]
MVGPPNNEKNKFLAPPLRPALPGQVQQLQGPRTRQGIGRVIPFCALCDQEPETGAHLLPADQDEGLEDWWTRSLEMLPLVQKRSVAAIQLYTTWNIWKERNRRIFDQKSLQPPQVFQLIREEVNLRRVACGTPVVS